MRRSRDTHFRRRELGSSRFQDTHLLRAYAFRAARISYATDLTPRNASLRPKIDLQNGRFPKLIVDLAWCDPERPVRNGRKAPRSAELYSAGPLRVEGDVSRASRAGVRTPPRETELGHPPSTQGDRFQSVPGHPPLVRVCLPRSKNQLRRRFDPPKRILKSENRPPKRPFPLVNRGLGVVRPLTPFENAAVATREIALRKRGSLPGHPLRCLGRGPFPQQPRQPERWSPAKVGVPAIHPPNGGCPGT